MIHGKIATRGNHRGGRWCSVCRHYHAYLYDCPSYSVEVLSEIAEGWALNESNWSDPEFIQERLDEGMPIAGVAIMQMFAGLR